MINFLNKIYQNYLNYFNIDQPKYKGLIVARQIWMVKAAFWAGGGMHLIYVIKYLLADTPRITHNLFAILISCVPSYYFLKKGKLEYAFFFAYYPAIIFQMFGSYQEANTNLNGELALIAYAAIPIVCYKLPYNIIGIVINYLLFVFVKIVKYPLHLYTLNEFINEILMVTGIYVAIFLVAYFFEIDYKILKENIKELNLQKQVIESQAEELKIANSTKNRLFSIISHDLRSPLASLKNVIQLVENEHISVQEFKELSIHIKQNVDNLSGMLENLLYWSLSQLEEIKPNLRSFDLDLIVDETLSIFKENAIQKQIYITKNSANNLQAYGDEYQIRTVLINLVNNALKFTPQHGKIVIDSSIEGQFITLKIMDSGIGIEKDELMQIFNNPTIKSGTAGEKGTGFGLFLCKELIEKNGGNIEIESVIGKGTTIILLLPLMVN
jgi:signal transduction histidine kinase